LGVVSRGIVDEVLYRDEGLSLRQPFISLGNTGRCIKKDNHELVAKVTVL
jgi:hypothetical protein